jgi:hypothetical protein
VRLAMPAYFVIFEVSAPYGRLVFYNFITRNWSKLERQNLNQATTNSMYLEVLSWILVIYVLLVS